MYVISTHVQCVYSVYYGMISSSGGGVDTYLRCFNEVSRAFCSDASPEHFTHFERASLCRTGLPLNKKNLSGTKQIQLEKTWKISFFNRYNFTMLQFIT